MRRFDRRLAAFCGALVISSVGLSAPFLERASASQDPANLSGERRDWPAYGGSAANTHYSDLAQINRSNVKQLAVAWSFDTGEQGVLQASPIIVNGVLYGITPTQKVFALDAASGELLWKFDSG